jgi:hypothetical protein
MNGQPHRHPLGRNQDEAPVDSRSRLIRMAFHLCGDTEHSIRRRIVTHGPQSRSRSSGECSRRGAESAAHGDSVVDFESERLISNGSLCGRDDPVGLTGLQTMRPDMLNGPLLRSSSPNETSRAQSQRERVKTGTEVGGSRRRRRRGCFAHPESLFAVSVPPVGDLFDFENLLPELILALGLALLIGNGLAWWKHRRGEAPRNVPEATYRPGRVRFLMVVGVVLTVWSAVTLFT